MIYTLDEEQTSGAFTRGEFFPPTIQDRYFFKNA